MKIGDKIKHPICGKGKILKETRDYYEVLFEKTPPFDFNAGVNPCQILKSSVKEIPKSYLESLEEMQENARKAYDEDDEDMMPFGWNMGGHYMKYIIDEDDRTWEVIDDSDPHNVIGEIHHKALFCIDKDCPENDLDKIQIIIEE